ncbi:MAG: hypothetical protein ACK4L7_05505 [Flavobacteriales bacterium]
MDPDHTRLDLRFLFTDRGQPLGPDRLVRDYVNTLCRVDELTFMLSGLEALDACGEPMGSWPQATITADLLAPGKATALGPIQAGEVHYLNVRLGPADATMPVPGNLCEVTGHGPVWHALLVKGIVDSNDDDRITAEDEPFVIRCRLPEASEPFMVHAHVSAMPGRTSTLELAVDAHALFHGIDIADEPHCTEPSLFNNQALTNLTTRVLGEPN